MILPDEQQLLDALGGAVVAADSAGRIVYMTGPCRALEGWAPDQALGQPLTILMPERMRQRHRDGFAQYRETGQSHLLGKTVRVPARRPGGDEVEVDLTVRMFRRPDGTDLVVASMALAASKAERPANLVRLESELARRAYTLI